MKRLTQFIKWVFWLLIITGTISATALGVFLFELSKTLPQNLEDELHKRNDVLPTVLYDREGNQIEDFFLNNLDISQHEYFNSIKDLKVSSHLLIKRDGEVIQFVPFNKRAWHAGISSFNGVDNCNDYSIGIELEGTDNSEFTDQQYNCLMKITKSLLLNYPNLCKERIVGHSTIAPNRKTDPGPFFNWLKLLNNL